MTFETAGDRAVLEGMLDRQRDEIAQLLDGLSQEEARQRLVPSLTCPLSLVKHAVFVEQVWFHSRVGGVPRADLGGLPDTVDESFLLDPGDSVQSVRQQFIEVCQHSRVVAAEHDLEDRFPRQQSEVSLRFIYAHVIAELARHAGHGDILVEQLQARREV